jgi:predicted GNAT superfamily acetyltransferase
VIAPIEAATLPQMGAALLALNRADVERLSPLDSDGLRRLVAMAFVARRIGEAEAMLIALDQDADYDSPNFQWFRQRYARFVYVDRVVVAAERRGQGLGRLLYLDLFARAAEAGHDRIVCEINTVPANPGSDAFHASLGFETVGSGVLPGGKAVRYVSRVAQA